MTDAAASCDRVVSQPPGPGARYGLGMHRTSGLTGSRALRAWTCRNTRQRISGSVGEVFVVTSAAWWATAPVNAVQLWSYVRKSVDVTQLVEAVRLLGLYSLVINPAARA